MDTKAPHVHACRQREQKINHTLAHTLEDIVMGNSGAHRCTVTRCCICKSNIGCSAHGWSGTHANDINTQVNTYKYICATHSCTVLYARWPRAETACAFALACQDSVPTEDSITPSHVDKICRPIVKENLLRCQNVICCLVKRSVLQHKKHKLHSHASAHIH